ncbi:hypothetical protein Y032_0003g1474 [Ancylostoma ceylanicum]|uniref:Uncharacterized protein n=2 Tax=Ancylostoma ceylanicum TaxID=53326 RepID=A0A016VY45_9BILA|nr:hypothetical protein Y032_0003g1474 [Ancylostoma ceylanicum]
MSGSSTEDLIAAIKAEDVDYEPARKRRDFFRRSAFDPKPVVVPTRFVPSYCIRNPVEAPEVSTAKLALKNVVAAEKRPPIVLKRPYKDVKTVEGESDGPVRKAELQRANDGRKEGPVRFWRTSSGKLVALDSRTNIRPDGLQRPMSEVLSNSRPKIVRLANGKLARIATRRIPTSLVRPNNPPPNQNSSEQMTGAGRHEGPSAEARVTESPEGIDVSTLMGSGPPDDEGPSLFEVRKKESGPVIKTEPVDEEEAYGEAEQFGSPKPPPPAQQPSLAAALNNISTTSTPVSDLVRIVDEPLFTPASRPNTCTLADCCDVCKKVVPGMKKHLLSVEARLSSLVDTVQNLIIHINPKDREAAEAAAKAIESAPRASEDSDDSPKRIPGLPSSSSTRSKDADRRNAGDERSSRSMPLPYKFDVQSGASGSDDSRGTPRPAGVMRIIRTVSSASKPQAGAKIITAPRFVVGGTRFIVADRAKASRTVSSNM